MKYVSVSYLQNLRASLSSQGAKNEAKSLGFGCRHNGFMSDFLHGIIVIILSRKYFAVRVIPGMINVQKNPVGALFIINFMIE